MNQFNHSNLDMYLNYSTSTYPRLAPDRIKFLHNHLPAACVLCPSYFYTRFPTLNPGLFFLKRMPLRCGWLTIVAHGQCCPISIERIFQDGGSRNSSALARSRRVVVVVDRIVEANGVAIALGAVLGAREGTSSRFQPVIHGEGWWRCLAAKWRSCQVPDQHGNLVTKAKVRNKKCCCS